MMNQLLHEVSVLQILGEGRSCNPFGFFLGVPFLLRIQSPEIFAKRRLGILISLGRERQKLIEAMM